MTTRAPRVANRTEDAQASAAQPPLAPPHVDFDDGPSGRILAAAREILLRDGYSGLTMDGLTLALGMSKKTLYVHFSSKDAMVSAILAATGATVLRRVGEILQRQGGFVEKLDGVLRIVAAHIGCYSAEILADLQRFAPQLYDEIDAIKVHNIPLGLTRVLKLGVEQGMVRDDVDTTFLVEYWLVVARGLHDPAMLARTQLTPQDAFNKALDLFFSGALTSSGRARVRARRE
ncbi:TetR/AcrR family transcriptional regulator [Paraburkholderia sp. GAS42]|jgi:AcrR family transcriptional regulator|uniref:TetR/AcrR family transcriptional regulator n=1 Tax=Paraburkholderia sp. GAS42 TaxID=3035135 RepID=UPI003D25F2D2